MTRRIGAIYIAVAVLISGISVVALNSPVEPALKDLSDQPEIKIWASTSRYPIAVKMRTANDNNNLELEVAFDIPKGQSVEWLAEVDQENSTKWTVVSSGHGASAELKSVRKYDHDYTLLLLHGRVDGPDWRGSEYISNMRSSRLLISSSRAFTTRSGAYFSGDLPTITEGLGDPISAPAADWHQPTTTTFSQSFSSSYSLNVLRSEPEISGEWLDTLQFRSDHTCTSDPCHLSPVDAVQLAPKFKAQSPELAQREKVITILAGIGIGVAATALFAGIDLLIRERIRVEGGEQSSNSAAASPQNRISAHSSDPRGTGDRAAGCILLLIALPIVVLRAIKSRKPSP